MSDLNQPPPVDHSVKIPHLVFGLLFLGVAGIWALVVADVITENRLPILAPAVLIVAGIVGLAASLASSRNRRQKRNDSEHYPQEPVEPQHDDEPELHSDLDFGPESESTLDDHTQEIR